MTLQDIFNSLWKSGIFRGYVYGFIILIWLISLGNIITYIEESKPIVREPWLPRSEVDKELLGNRKLRQKMQTQYNFKKESPWSKDQKEQTENWKDFLEQLENKGITILDPEAEDIWEEFK